MYSWFDMDLPHRDFSIIMQCRMPVEADTEVTLKLGMTRRSELCSKQGIRNETDSRHHVSYAYLSPWQQFPSQRRIPFIMHNDPNAFVRHIPLCMYDHNNQQGTPINLGQFAFIIYNTSKLTTQLATKVLLHRRQHIPILITT
jgi:hypothetical protein